MLNSLQNTSSMNLNSAPAIYEEEQIVHEFLAQNETARTATAQYK